MTHRVTLLDGSTGWGNCSECGDVYLVLKPAKLRKAGEVWVCKETLKRKPPKPKTRKKRTPNQIITEKCDDAWSLLVRAMAGHKCALAGFEKECSSGTLHTHHLVGRTDIQMRWEPLNGVALCYVHHIYGVHGTRATEMNHELFKRLPAGRMDELNEMRLTRREAKMKIDRNAVLESLKRLVEEAA